MEQPEGEGPPQAPPQPQAEGGEEPWLQEAFGPNAAVYRWRCSLQRLLAYPAHLHRSPSFEVGGLRWRLIVQKREEYEVRCVAMYLESMNAYEGEEPVHIHACYTLRVVNMRQPARTLRFTHSDWFSRGHTDWGTCREFHWKDVVMADAGFLCSATCPQDQLRALAPEELQGLTQADMALLMEVGVQVDSHHFRACTVQPRSAIGWVGLKNQGATCYLNSLLQSLFHISALRAAIFQLPTEAEVDKLESDSPTKVSLPLALQRLFWQLQYCEDAQKTKELTRAFGWAAEDAWRQQDIQELNRLLCDTLEQKMKGTPQEDCIQRLFMGQSQLYVKCINVQYESSRTEDFYDLSVCIKGYRNVEESLAGSLKPERLDGSNKYDAEEYGPQDADAGTLYLSFPPILTLHLKRFQFDLNTMRQEKLDDHFEFGPLLDVGRFTRAILRRCRRCGRWQPGPPEEAAQPPADGPSEPPPTCAKPEPATPLPDLAAPDGSPHSGSDATELVSPASAANHHADCPAPPTPGDSPPPPNPAPDPAAPSPAPTPGPVAEEADCSSSSACLCTCPSDHVPDVFELRTVVVHVGGPERGHYYAYIKKGDDWLCFDDMRVARCDPYEVFDANFGGRTPAKWWTVDSPVNAARDVPTAYMLVYVRQRERHLFDSHVAASPPPIPEFLEEHMQRTLAAEQQRRREKEERLNSLRFQLVTDTHLQDYWMAQCQSQCYTDGLYQFDDSHLCDVEVMLRTRSVGDLLEVLAERYHCPVEDVRLYRWVKDAGSVSRRPSSPILLSRERGGYANLDTPLFHLFPSDPANPVRLFVYTGPCVTREGADEAQHPILFCCKFYKPSQRHLSYATSLLVQDVTVVTVEDLFPYISRVANLPPGTGLVAYEEVRPGEVGPPLDEKLTLKECEMMYDGDIFVFQRELAEEDAARCAYPDIKSFYEWCQALVPVTFIDVKQREEMVEVRLELDADYDEVCESLLQAQVPRLEIPKEFLQLRPQVPHTSHPSLEPCKPTQRLRDMVGRGPEGRRLVLFYEVLEVPLASLENRLSLTLSWYVDHRLEEVVPLLLEDNLTVLEALQQLRSRLGLNALGYSPAEWRAYCSRLGPAGEAAAEPDAPLPLEARLAAGAPEDLQWSEAWCPLMCFRMQDPCEYGRPFHLHEKASAISKVQLKHSLRTTQPLEVRVERLPPRELNADRTGPVPDQELLSVSHAVQIRGRFSTHSGPFLVWVCPDDTVADVRERLRAALRVRSEEFHRWRLWIRPPDGPDSPLDDDELGPQSLLAVAGTTDDGAAPNAENGWRLILEHADPERREPVEKALRIDAL
eukprot:EG_transcript_409